MITSPFSKIDCESWVRGLTDFWPEVEQVVWYGLVVRRSRRRLGVEVHASGEANLIRRLHLHAQYTHNIYASEQSK